jgi:hypothetical protein
MAAFNWVNIVGGNVRSGSSGSAYLTRHVVKVEGHVVYSTDSERDFGLFLGELLARIGREQSRALVTEAD